MAEHPHSPFAPLPRELDPERFAAQSLPLADAAAADDEQADDAPRVDGRLYVPHGEGWSARIKSDWQKEYCYSQNPDEDFYHLLVSGEIYVQRGTEKYCLNCAVRHGYVTHDRLHWQRGGARPTDDAT